jgi:hypothetical protein
MARPGWHSAQGLPVGELPIGIADASAAIAPEAEGAR